MSNIRRHSDALAAHPRLLRDRRLARSYGRVGIAQVNSVDIGKHELLLAIEQRCLALPAFANAAPDHQPDAVK